VFNFLLFALKGKADIVWNIGTAYFGCGKFSEGGVRVFDPEMFVENVKHAKMVEIKLSQGAKPVSKTMDSLINYNLIGTFIIVERVICFSLSYLTFIFPVS
jgi:glutamate synthase domain-containing protein 2